MTTSIALNDINPDEFIFNLKDDVRWRTARNHTTRIHRISETLWEVQSKTKPNVDYYVQLTRKGYVCDCADFYYNRTKQLQREFEKGERIGKPFECWHIKSVIKNGKS